MSKKISTCSMAIAATLAFALNMPNSLAEGGERLALGKTIAFDRNKGNCLSCHMMDDGELPGNSAPPLLMMKLRYPDRDALRAQIYDAGVRNPNTVMPPYGRHRILDDEELDLVVDYVHSL